MPACLTCWLGTTLGRSFGVAGAGSGCKELHVTGISAVGGQLAWACSLQHYVGHWRHVLNKSHPTRYCLALKAIARISTYGRGQTWYSQQSLQGTAQQSVPAKRGDRGNRPWSYIQTFSRLIYRPAFLTVLWFEPSPLIQHLAALQPASPCTGDPRAESSRAMRLKPIWPKV